MTQCRDMHLGATILPALSSNSRASSAIEGVSVQPTLSVQLLHDRICELADCPSSEYWLFFAGMGFVHDRHRIQTLAHHNITAGSRVVLRPPSNARESMAASRIHRFWRDVSFNPAYEYGRANVLRQAGVTGGGNG